MKNQSARNFRTVLIRWCSAFALLVSVVFLSSCSINLPTIQKDAKETVSSVGDKIGDATDAAAEKFDRERHDLLDPELGMSRSDIKRELSGGNAPVVQDIPPVPSLPDVSSLLIEPRPPLIGQDKLVTISVTEDVPLRDVIMELARRADVDVEIDPGITGGIIFRAKDKPFSEVIERISELSGLRYSIKSGVLKVERDTPFVVNYNVGILNMIRSNSGSVNISTQVLSASVSGSSSSTGGGGGGTGGGLTSGSNTQLSTTYEGDVWRDLEAGITNIIGSYTGSVSTFVQNTGDDATSDELGAAPAAGGTRETSVADQSAILSVNRSTGLVSILASQRQHREVKNYIDSVLRSNTAQVLIEAKILEVNLTDDYRTGIDWQRLKLGSINNTAAGTLNRSTADNLIDSVVTIGVLQEDVFGISDFDLDLAVSLMQRFGVVKTLSNPRINAINNQQAVLTFAENRVYFDLEVETEESGLSTEQTNTFSVDSTPITVPIGVILTLQPSIDLDKNEITMNIRPTVSRVTTTVSDPGVALAVAAAENQIGSDLTVSNEIPVVEVREIDSILRVRNGQVMVIGGLIEERSINDDRGVPGLGEIPYVGNLFKSVQKTKTTVETVIFIKATIVPPYGVDREDKELYKTFSNERRPLAF